MRFPLGLAAMLIGLCAGPAAASDEKLDRIGELIDLKKAVQSFITIKNQTGICIRATIRGQDATGEITLTETLEPGESALFTLDLADPETFIARVESCDPSLCGSDSVFVDLEPGATVELCATQQSDGSESESSCELLLAVENGDGESPGLSLSTRETVVLTCSSSGLCVLALVGYLLGRTPRRREEQEAT